MDAIKEFLAGVNWEEIAKILVDFVVGLDIKGAVQEFFSFIRDLIDAILGKTQ